MNGRWWALVGGVVACSDGGMDPDVGDCPVPPAVNIVCAEIEDYGVADFRMRETTETSIRSGAEGTGGQRDGVNLQLIQGNPGEVAQGLFQCSEQAVSIDFRESVGTTSEVTWRQDDDAEGECFIQVTLGGMLGTDVVQGTFAATLRAADDQLRAIRGSFHVGARTNQDE